MRIYEYIEAAIALALWVSYVFVFGYLNHPNIAAIWFPVALVAITAFAVWFFLYISNVTEEGIPRGIPRGIPQGIYALAMGFVGGEIGWAFSFLPLAPISKATILFVFIFILWRFVRYYRLRSSYVSVFIRDMIIGIIAAALIILTTPWLPI